MAGCRRRTSVDTHIRSLWERRPLYAQVVIITGLAGLDHQAFGIQQDTHTYTATAIDQDFDNVEKVQHRFKRDGSILRCAIVRNYYISDNSMGD